MAKLNFVTVFLATLAALGVQAVPMIEKRQSITTLTSSQVAVFKPFSWFAATAYCDPSVTKTWTCGTNCNANSDFIPVASGGDGSSIQFWYVGYSPSQSTVVVAHQGTDTSQIEALATDAEIVRGSLDSTLFPGIDSSVGVHDGFRDEQAKTATQVLAAVKSAISAHGATKVTVVGHSLGAAIALLDGIYLPLHITGVTFKTIAYGMPRVGNQEFADYVDAHISLTHINNKDDIVPIVPGRFLDFAHVPGEIHILNDLSWIFCPGQDNEDANCTIGYVPNIFSGDTDDHSGPYDGVKMGCS
ncbi:lipase class 3 family protein [Macrolepiota fuliginosa MF-IS2]|uniref:Lipase class 3 family protein n=1 Tax=Macrolepiota fuliginosa MF-IS2 TaxID=1400762 RepID=A0A9P5XRG8_9AGAR|nr:lipase class 3 family protein [Macrolepiota fuliginosa MF-IS2]